MSDLAQRLNLPPVIVDFARFGIVGVVGFVINVAVVYAVRGLIGLYVAELLAWFVAATVTWRLNRAWTFSDRGTAPMHVQWRNFMAANSVGFVLNYTAYSALITISRTCAAHPILAIFAGVMAGMFANFFLSRRFVFR